MCFFFSICDIGFINLFILLVFRFLFLIVLKYRVVVGLDVKCIMLIFVLLGEVEILRLFIIFFRKLSIEI